MNIIGNSNVGMHFADATQPKGLNEDDTKLLGTIFSGAVSSGDRTKAGRGYMGLTRDAKGLGLDFRSVKFMTHWYERGVLTDSQIMKSVSGCNLAGEAAFEASEQLEHILRTMAEKVGAGRTVDAMLGEYKRTASHNARSLLSRKIVFQVATVVNDNSARLGGRRVDVANVATSSSKFVNTSVKALDVSGDTLYSDMYGRTISGFRASRMFVDDVVAQLVNTRDGQVDRDLRDCVDRVLAAVRAVFPNSDVRFTVEDLKAVVAETLKRDCESQVRYVGGKGNLVSSAFHELFEKRLREKFGDVGFALTYDRFDTRKLCNLLTALQGKLEPYVVSAANRQRIAMGENLRKTEAHLRQYWPGEGNPFAKKIPGLTDEEMIRALADLKTRKGGRQVDFRDVMWCVKGMCPGLAHKIRDIAKEEQAGQFVQRVCLLLNNPGFNASLADVGLFDEAPTLLSANGRTVLSESDCDLFEDGVLQNPKYMELFLLPAGAGEEETSYETIMEKFKLVNSDAAKALEKVTGKLREKPAVLLEVIRVVFTEVMKTIDESEGTRRLYQHDVHGLLDDWICQMIEGGEINLENVTDVDTLRVELENYRRNA